MQFVIPEQIREKIILMDSVFCYKPFERKVETEEQKKIKGINEVKYFEPPPLFAIVEGAIWSRENFHSRAD